MSGISSTLAPDKVKWAEPDQIAPVEHGGPTDAYWQMVPLYAVFFCSGVAALVYEVSWNRQLEGLLGHTSHAAAVVLTAYFGGMALGYAAGGKLAARGNPFYGYAVCELLAAAWAAAVPLLLATAVRGQFPLLHQLDGSLLPLLLRVLFCLILLAPATVALGATLPFMNEMMARSHPCGAHVPSRISFTTAYACNTLGALLGVLLASSWLIAEVGVARSSYAACLLSATCAFVAWLLRKRGPRAVLDLAGSEVGRTAHSPTERSPWFWLCLVSISGAATLALEVLYARLFTLVFHNSTYTFSFVLIAFLLGLSLGALVARQLLIRFAPQAVVQWTSFAAAMSVPLSILGFVFATRLQYVAIGGSFIGYYAAGLTLVLLVVLPTAVCLGVFLPAAWIASDAQGKLRSGTVGRLTFANTSAATLGALAASFWFFPTFGLWRSFVLVTALLVLPALLVSCRSRGRRMPTLALLLVLGVALPLTVGNPERWTAENSREVLVHRWHSSYGWIDVVRDRFSGAHKVRQNLHYRFGATGLNAAREFRQAHLPLLLHGQPRETLFLGLGTGMTAGGAVPHQQLAAIDIVELIPEVIPAVRLLRADNRNIVDDPRTEVIVDDARHFLATTTRQYDVIVSDLFVPWESATGYLYTVEQFQAARARLKSKGIFCQWLPLYQLGTAEFEMIADSLRSVFPHVSLWWGRLDATRPIMALVAAEEPLTLPAAAIDKRLAELSASGQFQDELLANPQRLIELYAGDWPLRTQATLNTDEHPRVEFQTPVSHLRSALLRGPRLRNFLLQTIEKTGTQSVKYLPLPGELPRRDRGWQRQVMFPQPGKK
ncbi:MAG: fused MFS/spermidine synthase [Planctomycetales bacterium]|nr:fused MFS/spermidine synthase [Planctomycetales bacterium]